MATNFKNQMREVMSEAWRMFRITGESFAECLKKSWLLLKLKLAMKKRTVQFFYQKVSGEIRQAFGTKETLIASSLSQIEAQELCDEYRRNLEKNCPNEFASYGDTTDNSNVSIAKRLGLV